MSKVKSSRTIRDRKRALKLEKEMAVIADADEVEDELFEAYQRGELSLDEYMKQ